MVESTIASLKTHYPDSPIMLFDDLKVRLKLPVFRGAWTERFLKAFLETDHDICIKVDPDTKINSRAPMPDAPIFAAFRYALSGARVLAGGAIGFRRETAKAILNSNLLHDEKYGSSLKYAYARFRPPYKRSYEPEVREWVALQDEITSDIVDRLGIVPLDWDAISFTDPTALFYHPR